MDAGDLDSLIARMAMSFMTPSRRDVYRCFFRFAYTGNLASIKEFLEIEDEQEGNLEKTLRISNEDGMTALHCAAAGGSKQVCQFLLETGKVDINMKDTVAGETPLHHAISKGRFPVAVFLLQNGADPNVRTKKRRTALHYAIEHVAGSKEFVKLLISKGADVNAVAADVGTPLQFAAERGKADYVKLLLHHKADPNGISHDACSPLHASIRGQSLECMELLLKAGSDPNFGSSEGRTPLGYAASQEGSKEIIRCLLIGGADPNVVDTLGMTAVEYAALSKRRGLVRILFPKTSPIPTIPQWTISGLFEQVNSVNATEEREQKKRDIHLFLMSKGDGCLDRDDCLGAIQCYTQAMVLKPNDDDALYARSLCWATMDEGGLALEDAEACIKLRPDWPDAYYLAGTSRMILKEYKMAASAFSHGLKLDPDDTMLGDALRVATEAVESLKAFDFSGRC